MGIVIGWRKRETRFPLFAGGFSRCRAGRGGPEDRHGFTLSRWSAAFPANGWGAQSATSRSRLLPDGPPGLIGATAAMKFNDQGDVVRGTRRNGVRTTLSRMRCSA